MRGLANVRAGTKLIVTDRWKDPKLTPGSMIRFIKFSGIDTQYPVLGKCSVLFLRKGKTGLQRLDTLTIYTPLIKSKHKRFMEVLPIGRGWMVDVEKADDDIQGDNFDMLSWMVAKVYRFSNHIQFPPKFPPLPGDHILPMYNHIKEHFAHDRAETLKRAQDQRKKWLKEVNSMNAMFFRQEVAETLHKLDKERAALKSLEQISEQHFPVITKKAVKELQVELQQLTDEWVGIADRLNIPVSPHQRMHKF